MNFLTTFLKGIVVGLGAVAPGLSGSILMVIFGLYQKVVSTVSHIFKGFKKNLLFLLPLAAGIGIGAVIFSLLIDLPMTAFPMQTNFLFLGLVLGTLPVLIGEVKKEGLRPQHYVYTAIAFAGAFVFFVLGIVNFPEVTDPTVVQSMILGLAVSAAYLIPGVDSFAILSTFGLYNLWKDSLGHLDMKVLLPAALGLLIGGVLISLLFNKLLSSFYSATYSVIFGLFLAIIINFAYRECYLACVDELGWNVKTIVSILLILVGFAASLLFSRLDRIVGRIKKTPATAAAPAEDGASSCEQPSTGDATDAADAADATYAAESKETVEVESVETAVAAPTDADDTDPA